MITRTIMSWGAVALAAALVAPAVAQNSLDEAVAKIGTKSAPSAPVQIKLASPANVVAAIKSCSTAVSANGLIPANLAKAGWKAAPVKNSKGSAVKLAARIYSHSGSSAVIALPPTNSASGGCMVMARMADVKDVALAGNVLSGEIGVKPVKSKSGSPLWLAGDRAIEINTSGSANAPSVRAVVAYAKGGKS